MMMTKNTVSQAIWDHRNAEALWLYADCMLPLCRKFCLTNCPSIDVD